eukprot:4590018-Pleurochrysis_carterae.AAC.1
MRDEISLYNAAIAQLVCTEVYFTRLAEEGLILGGSLQEKLQAISRMTEHGVKTLPRPGEGLNSVKK